MSSAGDAQANSAATSVSLSAFEGESLIQIRVNARPERLRIIRCVVTEAATASGCGESCVRDIVIAVDEACQNVIRHAYGDDPHGELVLDIRRVGEHLTFSLVDFAQPVEVASVRPRNLDDLRQGAGHTFHPSMYGRGSVRGTARRRWQLLVDGQANRIVLPRVSAGRFGRGY